MPFYLPSKSFWLTPCEFCYNSWKSIWICFMMKKIIPGALGMKKVLLVHRDVKSKNLAVLNSLASKDQNLHRFQILITLWVTWHNIISCHSNKKKFHQKFKILVPFQRALKTNEKWYVNHALKIKSSKIMFDLVF